MSRTFVTVLIALACAGSAAHADIYKTRGVVMKLPEITLNEPFDQSPQSVTLDASYVVTSRDVELLCGDKNTLLVPLARVHLVNNGDWVFSVNVPGMTLYLIQRDSCIMPLDGSTLPGSTEMVLWGRVATAPPSQVKVDIHLVQAAAPVKIELGEDLSRPVAVRVDIPGGKQDWRPLEITSPVRHHIRLSALGAPHGEFRFGHKRATKQRNDDMVRPDEPLAIDVFSEQPASVWVVVEEPNKTVATESDIYGAPSADAPVADRSLSQYSRIVAPSTMTRASADLAGRLFTTVDPSFFVYASDAHNLGCRLVAGEPLLLFANDEVMHANGRVETCSFQPPERLTDVITTRRPPSLVMPEIADPQSDEHEMIWHDEDFLSAADHDKTIGAYKAAKATASACYSREWARLDPDGKADQYDVVTRQNGKVTKVEGYGDRIFRQVYNACRLSAMEQQRDAIYKRLAKTFKADERKRLDAIAKRLAGT